MATDPAAAATAPPERAAVDWDLAARRARQLTRPGPAVPVPEAGEYVAELRAGSHAAPAHVGAVTGLLEPAMRAGAGPVYVLDRPRWAEANVTMLRALIGDVLPPPTLPWGAQATGAAPGAGLALPSTPVRGQYDPYTTPAAGTGRLVLVAPTILTSQREPGMRRQDFGLWVCLHEQTHALQFAAADWLAEHMRTRMRELMRALTATGDGGERLQQLVRSLPQVLRGQQPEGATSALLDAVLNEQERDLMAEAMATMSLLEGHADVVMDEVGPRVVPTVRKIRRAFERRRAGTSPMDLLLRQLLGLDAKLAQYRNGAKFVRGVVDQVGHEGFNAVWAAPDHLPRPAELADPGSWVRRVHG